ncbi:hypothetical protein FB451DRAFT_1536093 [Mycena latifolia]|nr:hypothetical protein FB451DRAFT_1536093 [Mycena latifolia]
MPKTSSPRAAKPKTPYSITKGKKRGLLAQSGQATLANIVAIQQNGLKNHGKAATTTKKYSEVVVAGRKWLAEYVGGKDAAGEKKAGKTPPKPADSDSESDGDESEADEGPDMIAPDVGESEDAADTDSSCKFDAPEYKKAFDTIPNEHSPKMLALYLAFKIFGQDKKIGTADTIRAAMKRMWKMCDGDTYRGKWHFNTTSARWEGNPVDSAEVEDIMESIKNKCGKDGGDRKHSLAMTKECMTKIFAWSDEVCPPSSYNKPSTTVEEQTLKTKHLAFKCFSSTAWTIWSRCFELVKVQEKHLTFGLEDAKAFNTLYFDLHLTNRKGWQKRVNKTRKESDLRSGRFKICSQPDLPACDAFNWMTRWRKYLADEIYGRPLKPEDYIFPAIGANGKVQTGEHISHDDVDKWIKEFARGAKLPQTNGTFSTHCFRRGGAQYRFMFAPVGRRWTLRQVRWWGGWAEGEHRDTLIKYILDELNTYEDDYSGMLLPVQDDTDATFLGEGSSLAPATTEHISLLHRSLSTDIRTVSADIRTVSGAVDKLCLAMAGVQYSHAPAFHPPNLSVLHQSQSAPPVAAFSLTRPLIPITLTANRSHPLPFVNTSNTPSSPPPRGRPLPNKHLAVPDVPIRLPDGSRSHKRDSWRIIVRHWTEGDPAHGLTTPLRDWPKEWLTGANRQFFAAKHQQRRVIATEYLTKHVFPAQSMPLCSLQSTHRYNSDEKAFLTAYPEAEEGGSRLLAAINKARRARGDLVTRK